MVNLESIGILLLPSRFGGLSNNLNTCAFGTDYIGGIYVLIKNGR